MSKEKSTPVDPDFDPSLNDGLQTSHHPLSSFARLKDAFFLQLRLLFARPSFVEDAANIQRSCLSCIVQYLEQQFSKLNDQGKVIVGHATYYETADIYHLHCQLHRKTETGIAIECYLLEISGEGKDIVIRECCKNFAGVYVPSAVLGINTSLPFGNNRPSTADILHQYSLASV